MIGSPGSRTKTIVLTGINSRGCLAKSSQWYPLKRHGANQLSPSLSLSLSAFYRHFIVFAQDDSQSEVCFESNLSLIYISNSLHVPPPPVWSKNDAARAFICRLRVKQAPPCFHSCLVDTFLWGVETKTRRHHGWMRAMACHPPQTDNVIPNTSVALRLLG